MVNTVFVLKQGLCSAYPPPSMQPRRGRGDSSSRASFLLSFFALAGALPWPSAVVMGPPAVAIYGQMNLSGVSSTHLSQPRGVSVAQGHLWVADWGNLRALRFPVQSSTADVVLGQPGFGSNMDISTNASSVNAYGVAASPNLLYVADFGSNRVISFPPTTFAQGTHLS